MGRTTSPSLSALPPRQLGHWIFTLQAVELQRLPRLSPGTCRQTRKGKNNSIGRSVREFQPHLWLPPPKFRPQARPHLPRVILVFLGLKPGHEGVTSSPFTPPRVLCAKPGYPPAICRERSGFEFKPRYPGSPDRAYG